ncbi:hypothetical protein [Halovenus salina]|uniref:Thioredoxin n=1 Tax=Halovenus salina TaxID=1510225 RepID=A0ABD5W1R1_9EURY|nr:hypothetical protein [Halovenus salina]
MLLDVCTAWCGPYKATEPAIGELSAETDGLPVGTSVERIIGRKSKDALLSAVDGYR